MTAYFDDMKDLIRDTPAYSDEGLTFPLIEKQLVRDMYLACLSAHIFPDIRFEIRTTILEYAVEEGPDNMPEFDYADSSAYRERLCQMVSALHDVFHVQGTRSGYFDDPRTYINHVYEDEVSELAALQDVKNDLGDSWPIYVAATRMFGELVRNEFGDPKYLTSGYQTGPHRWGWYAHLALHGADPNAEVTVWLDSDSDCGLPETMTAAPTVQGFKALADKVNSLLAASTGE